MMRGTTAEVECAVCGCKFTARVADRKRGWAKCCSKSIAIENGDYVPDYEDCGGFDNTSCQNEDDHRPDWQVKREIYEREIKDKYNVIGVFEDRQQCVDMWRSLGLTCFQVAKGEY